MSKIYKTMQGIPVELDKLVMRNETTIAVGNVKVNARGDELGPGGKIIKKHVDEDVVRSDNVMVQKRQQSLQQEIEQKTVVEEKKKPLPKNLKKSEE